MVIKLDGKNDGRDHLALFGAFALILCFINEIDFLLDRITIPPGMINKGFAATKATLMLYQKLSVGIRKRFEGRRRSGDGRLLPPIAGAIGIAGAIRTSKLRRTTTRTRRSGSGRLLPPIAGAIRVAGAVSELRRTTTGTRRHRSGLIRSVLITKWQCLFKTQCTADKFCPGFVLDRGLRNDESLDVMEKTFNKVKVASGRSDKLWNLVGK